jgi:EAL domain-containing protein (putative c-di-GMP-specific phosphodiesterase class I)
LSREYLRLKSALLDRTTGLASYHLHLDDLRTLLDDRRGCALVHVSCAELGLVESIYGWQVLDRVLQRAVNLVSALRGKYLSSRAVMALNGVAGEEIILFEPGEADSGEITSEQAARIASAVAGVLEDGFGSEEFASMTPKLAFRAGYAIVEDDPQFRFERIVYRAVERARTQQARREERQRTEWEGELKRILREREVVTLYQPVVRLDTLEIIGYEAFTCGPAAGPLKTPGLLFAISDRLGLSKDLDRLCRHAALAGAGAIRRRAKLFLNTRPANLIDPEWWGKDLAERLSQVGIQPSDIVIEIPERALDDPRALIEPLTALRAHGYAFALDDVGTGYSSLMAIEVLRPEYLKVDLSLVHGVDRSLLKQEVISSVLQIANRLGAKVVAEGIEREEELRELRRSGAQLGQGYLFARPGPSIVPGPLIRPGES